MEAWWSFEESCAPNPDITPLERTSPPYRSHATQNRYDGPRQGVERWSVPAGRVPREFPSPRESIANRQGISPGVEECNLWEGSRVLWL
jgi:hypothetical protein